MLLAPNGEGSQNMADLKGQGKDAKGTNMPVAPEGSMYVLRKKSVGPRVYKPRANTDALLAVLTTAETQAYVAWFKTQTGATQASIIRILEAIPPAAAVQVIVAASLVQGITTVPPAVK